MAPFRGPLRIPGVDATFEVTDAVLENIGRTYLHAVMEAGQTYRHVAAAKGERNFIPEVSTDEATEPQLPFELFFILGALAREKIPVQTIAPKFSGKFLKGIDYVGDVAVFAREFEADLAVVKHAIERVRPAVRRSSSASTPAATSSRSIRHIQPRAQQERRRACTSRPPGRPGSRR